MDSPEDSSTFVYELVDDYGIVLRRWTTTRFIPPGEGFTVDGRVYTPTYVSFHDQAGRQIVRIRVERPDPS